MTKTEKIEIVKEMIIDFKYNDARRYKDDTERAKSADVLLDDILTVFRYREEYDDEI